MPATILTHPTKDLTTLQAQCEQSLLVPILALALMRAETADQRQPDHALDDILHQWSEVATTLMRRYDHGLLQQARAAARDLIENLHFPKCAFGCGRYADPQQGDYCSVQCRASQGESA